MKDTHPRHDILRNVNCMYAEEIAEAGFNTHLALWLTEHVGTMWTAYAFAVLAIVGLFCRSDGEGHNTTRITRHVLFDSH